MLVKDYTKLFIEVTYRCNLTCHMCWYHGDNGIIDNKNLRKEIDLETIKKLLDQLTKVTTVDTVIIAGAEPFLRNDIFEIIKAVKIKKLKCIVLTNATLFNDIILEKIVNSDVDALRISLDGREESHTLIRKSKNAFKKTVKAIKKIDLLKQLKNKKNPLIVLNTVITKENLEDLDSIVELAKELNCRLDFQHLMWLKEESAINNMKILKHELGIDDITAIGFINSYNQVSTDEIYEKINDAKLLASQINQELRVSQFSSKDLINAWYSETGKILGTCEFLMDSIRVSASGTIKPCQFIDYSYGSLNEQNLSDILNKPEKIKFEKVFFQEGGFPICERCCKSNIKGYQKC